MLLELYPTDRESIDNGNFPFLHDCVLKVEYIHGSPISYQYFTTWLSDSGKIIDVLLKCSLVKKVNIASVEELPDVW